MNLSKDFNKKCTIFHISNINCIISPYKHSKYIYSDNVTKLNNGVNYAKYIVQNSAAFCIQKFVRNNKDKYECHNDESESDMELIIEL